MKNKKLSIIINGFIKENPVLVLVLGTCPTLAISTSIISALAMGISATLVLIGSNLVISLLRKIIPDQVRIPCYIVIIAGFVTVVQMLLQAYLPDLFDMLGVYLALIVVNCIILAVLKCMQVKMVQSTLYVMLSVWVLVLQLLYYVWHLLEKYLVMQHLQDKN